MYYLFGGATYYSQGGRNDFINNSEDLEQLTSLAVDLLTGDDDVEWFHITDASMNIICGTEYQGYGGPRLKTGSGTTFCYDSQNSKWEWK